MQIDKLAITTQPRNSWKSFDLGCRMALAWWQPLAVYWLLLTLPIFILANLVSLEYGMLLMWLFKPWYERGLLYIFSRQVFGQNVSAIDTIKVLPSLIKPMWLSSVTWRRLAPSRAFDLAVLMLEGLTGEKRSSRLETLHRTSDNNTGWWLIICVHWELFILCGLGVAIFSLMPEGVDFDLMWMFELESNIVNLVYNSLLYIAWLLVAPFYVGGSFAAYLNRRILLEGWDIELNFRQISLQKQATKIASVVIIGMSCLFGLGYSESPMAQEQDSPPSQIVDPSSDFTITEAQAQQSATDEQAITDMPESYQQVRIQLEELMQKPPFKEDSTRKEWRWISDQDDVEELESEPDLDWLKAIIAFIAKFAELILWLCFIGVLLTLIWLSREQLLALFRFKKAQKIAEVNLPSFSKAYSVSALPTDIPDELNRLLASESYRKLLSLLLVTSFTNTAKITHLPLTESMTEAECKSVIAEQLEGEPKLFLLELIDTWVKLAWAHRWPEASAMQALCSRWLFLFNSEEEKTVE